MKTSAIRHPKHEHCLTVHSWQLKATNKHLYAALLLSYLEEKFNLLLELKNMGVNYNKGWLKLNLFQLQNGIFAESKEYLDSAIETLKILKFIEVAPDTPEFPREQTEIWIKFNALQINKWVDIHCKAEDQRMLLLDFGPFIGLSVLMERTQTVTVIEEVEVKAASPLKKFEGSSLIETARTLFQFWKWVTNKPRSQPQDKYLRMIIDRIQEGYSEIELAHSFYGMLYRKATDFAKYDAIHYIVKENARVDRMTADAETIGITQEIAVKEFNDFKNLYSVGAKIEPRVQAKQELKNSSSGQEIK